MTPPERRYKTLSLLRRRDREAALLELEAALTASARITSALHEIEKSILALREHLEKMSFESRVTAGALMMSFEHRALSKHRLQRKEAQARELRVAAEDASARVDYAKDAVAKAQKALSALEKEADSP